MRTFFAYLDLLGFKDLFNKHNSVELHHIVNDCIHNFNKAVLKSLEYQDVKAGKVCKDYIKIKGYVEFHLLSDSILVWCKKTDDFSFHIISGAIQQLLFWGLKNGKPLRGVLTYGDIFFSKYTKVENPINNEAVFGKALVKAYIYEGKMQWSGCIVTPQAWTRLKRVWKQIIIQTETPEGFFNHIPRLVWYPVPFKNICNNEKTTRYIKCIAIDWNDELYGQKIEDDEINKCFMSEKDDVILKAIETKKFFDYTKKLHENFNDVNKLKNIPLPNSKYIIRGVIPHD